MNDIEIVRNNIDFNSSLICLIEWTYINTYNYLEKS